MAGYKNNNKDYDIDGIGESNYFGIKRVSGKLSRDGKSAFYVCKIVDEAGNRKLLHDTPLTNYNAYMQFKDIVLNNPQALKKGTYKLNKDGTLPKALVKALGTNTIAKLDGVRTIAETKAEMKSWSKA